MRFQQIRHLRCRSEMLVSDGRVDPLLWESFCRECRELVPDGRAVFRHDPVPTACWEGGYSRVRLVFFSVSDGTELLLELDTGMGTGLVERLRPRYRRRLQAFMLSLKSTFETGCRRRRWFR